LGSSNNTVGDASEQGGGDKTNLIARAGAEAADFYYKGGDPFLQGFLYFFALLSTVSYFFGEILGMDKHFLIAGLGNPGREYAGNRHNVGFMVVDEIARSINASWRAKFRGEIAGGVIENHKVQLLKPHTYMNLSGVSVGEVATFYKIPPAQVIVIHDDLDLEVGRVKVKKGGGHGGHNGLKSIDAHITQDYWRIRIGIGHPGRASMVSDYVLSDFNKDEQEVVEQVICKISTNIALLMAEQVNEFHANLKL
jgi:PTH1 family peptidyl-tRNA hydrolase